MFEKTCDYCVIYKKKLKTPMVRVGVYDAPCWRSRSLKCLSDGKIYRIVGEIATIDNNETYKGDPCDENDPRGTLWGKLEQGGWINLRSSDIYPLSPAEEKDYTEIKELLKQILENQGESFERLYP